MERNRVVIIAMTNREWQVVTIKKNLPQRQLELIDGVLENPEEAARSLLYDKTGYYGDLRYNTQKPDHSGGQVYFYLSIFSRPCPKHQPNDTEVELVPMEKWFDMVKSGQVTDPLSLVAATHFEDKIRYKASEQAAGSRRGWGGLGY